MTPTGTDTEQPTPPRATTPPGGTTGPSTTHGPDTQRPRHRLPWILVAITGALFIVVPLTTSLLADHASRTGAYTGPDNDRPHTVSAVEVDAGSAQITVTTGPARHVALDATLNWLLKKPTIDRTWDGDTLKVHAQCNGYVDRYLQNCQIDLHLTVPPEVALTVRSDSGAIRVRDLTGPADLTNGSGGMTLRGLKGTVRATVGSGEIEATQLATPEADLKTGSGTIRAEFTAPPRRANAVAGSGTVALTVPDGTHYRILGHSGSGARTIADTLADNTSDHTLDVSSGSGSVTVGYPAWGPPAG
ncbi:DUF4097 family beta strand repeat-containing protein [Streptomyces sp. NBC_00083]|uniref:DUF4097 family beta strand repeat-containing protein n=1 Tax=Streptomyces sp. NBC_00083 TaxID=2975647 RepID=UPI002250489C|nr:DUF4097 family beta strand repeat-containing protein [Streptomyces sp. NBC_00083]MCX5382599.1 DUF4097 domain-containing protein [Streptomyces sp. NBC_00083]